MKSYELKPTQENLLSTLLKDTIGRNLDVYSFAEILDKISESCSIAIDGSWGTGKTFFVKQTKMVIDAHNDFISSMPQEEKENIKKLNTDLLLQPQVCVYYDAWENDNDNEPILSLIYSIISSVDTDYTLKSNVSFIQKAASILDFFTDKNWTDLITNLKGGNALDEIRKRKNIENDIKEFLDSLLLEKGNRLIVFIDELDRCKPSYSVKLLERIKHYFDNDRITFVFSINASELQHTIKKHYGNDFDACRYLDRFFDLRIALPPVDKSKFYQSINFNNSFYIYDSVCSAVIDNYNLQLREIAKYIRLVKIAAYEPTHDNRKYEFIFSDGKAREFCLLYIIPIMIGLKIYNITLYDKFISGKDSTPLIEIMNRLKHSRFDSFLNNDETYDEKETEKNFVTLEDKLKQIYDAIFVTTYSGNIYHTIIGKYEFGKGTKDILIRTVSMLSPYANFDID